MRASFGCCVSRVYLKMRRRRCRWSASFSGYNLSWRLARVLALPQGTADSEDVPGDWLEHIACCFEAMARSHFSRHRVGTEVLYNTGVTYTTSPTSWRRGSNLPLRDPWNPWDPSTAWKRWCEARVLGLQATSSKDGHMTIHIRWIVSGLHEHAATFVAHLECCFLVWRRFLVRQS